MQHYSEERQTEMTDYTYEERPERKPRRNAKGYQDKFVKKAPKNKNNKPRKNEERNAE